MRFRSEAAAPGGADAVGRAWDPADTAMRRQPKSHRKRFLTLMLVGVVLVPLPRLVPTIANATNVIIQEGTTQREDLYALPAPSAAAP